MTTPDSRQSFSYTPFFCEENIWLLARDLVAASAIAENARVLFFAGAGEYFAIQHQDAFPENEIGFWDYHVVLHDTDAGLIYDFDSRLVFAVSAVDYFNDTFPPQNVVPPQWRARVRSVAVDFYLRTFTSDRAHMLDESGAPIVAFPVWPVITSADPVWLDQYRDVEQSIEGCPVCDVERYAKSAMAGSTG